MEPYRFFDQLLACCFTFALYRYAYSGQKKNSLTVFFCEDDTFKWKSSAFFWHSFVENKRSKQMIEEHKRIKYAIAVHLGFYCILPGIHSTLQWVSFFVVLANVCSKCNKLCVGVQFGTPWNSAAIIRRCPIRLWLSYFAGKILNIKNEDTFWCC